MQLFDSELMSSGTLNSRIVVQFICLDMALGTHYVLIRT